MKPLGPHLAWSLFLLIGCRLLASAAPAAVRRPARAITPEEIRAAVELALAERGLTTEAEAIGGRLSTAVTVFIAGDEAALEVTDIRCEPFWKKTLFRLRVPGDARTLPFLVTAEGCAEALATPLRGAGGARPVARGLSDLPQTERRAQARNRPVLAEPGKSAKLIIEGEGFRISTRVIPLERGAEGQQIRVRSLDSRRVFKAQVIGPALVAVAP